MNLCYLDASAWSKRYSNEYGHDVLDALFDDILLRELVLLTSGELSYAEMFSMIVRFRNRTSVNAQDFSLIVQRITDDERRISWLPIPENAFRRGIAIILKHNLNATDAALLNVLLDVRHQIEAAGHQLWLVASDKRFLRAAANEGLSCLDPEVSSAREMYELFGG